MTGKPTIKPQREQRIVRLPEGESFGGFPGEDSLWSIRSIISETSETVGPGANYRRVYMVIVERDE